MRMVRKRRGCVIGFVILLTLGCLAADQAAAREFGPQGIVREFCEADGLGERVSGRGWAKLPALVGWVLEPAWDDVAVITGYQVDGPRPSTGGALAVAVHYSVVGQVSALGFDGTAYVETVTFRVHAPDAAGWRIIGPPPVPHIFGNQVDVEGLRRSLQQVGSNFVTNSVFVWQMLHGAGWNVPYERTADLLSGSTYRPVERPAAGDLVVYLRDGTPYHVGLLEAENQSVSATLNAGIVRSSIDAFAGDVKYLRLLEPVPPADDGMLFLRAAPADPTPARPPAQLRRAPSSKAKKGHAQPRAKSRPPAQPSAVNRVEGPGGSKTAQRESKAP
jgi:hypothetical protein